MKNYYDILEVNKRASREVIDKAYKVLAKKYHPDLYSSAEKKYNEKKLKELNEAYRVLSDYFLREQYDKELEFQEKEERETKYEQANVRKMRENEEEIQSYSMHKAQDYKKSEIKQNKVGSLGSLIDLTKLVLENRPRVNGKRKKLNQKDFLALGLTVISLIIIGIILWFIPFTNGWMRELIFENPIFSWMFK